MNLGFDDCKVNIHVLVAPLMKVLHFLSCVLEFSVDYTSDVIDWPLHNVEIKLAFVRMYYHVGSDYA